MQRFTTFLSNQLKTTLIAGLTRLSWGLPMVGVLLMLCSFAPIEAAITRTGPERVAFGEDTLVLGRTTGDAQGVWKQYLPPNQTLESWTESLSLRVYYQETSASELMKKQRDLIIEHFPGTEFGEQVTTDRKEARLRYLVRTDDPVTVAKFSLWRFIAMDQPRPQVVAYQYSARTFQPDQTEFKRKVAERMAHWTQNLLQAQYEVPTLRVNRRQVDALAKRGAQLIQDGQVADGIRLFMQTTEEDPQNPQRFYNLGRVLFSYARNQFKADTEQEALILFARAREFLEMATELYSVFNPESPNHAETWFLLGEIAFHIHEDYELAYTHYERAQKVNPSHRGARAALQAY